MLSAWTGKTFENPPRNPRMHRANGASASIHSLLTIWIICGAVFRVKLKMKIVLN